MQTFHIVVPKTGYLDEVDAANHMAAVEAANRKFPKLADRGLEAYTDSEFAELIKKGNEKCNAEASARGGISAGDWKRVRRKGFVKKAIKHLGNDIESVTVASTGTVYIETENHSIRVSDTFLCGERIQPRQPNRKLHSALLGHNRQRITTGIH